MSILEKWNPQKIFFLCSSVSFAPLQYRKVRRDLHKERKGFSLRP